MSSSEDILLLVSSQADAATIADRVAVVGAGCTGLAGIKCCLDEGLAPVCFEMSSGLGGLWRFTDDVTEGRGSVMNTTVINTSKEMMSLSDFPVPREFPNFMHHTKVLEYYKLYADKFNLCQYISFNKKVISIKRSSNNVLSTQTGGSESKSHNVLPNSGTDEAMQFTHSFSSQITNTVSSSIPRPDMGLRDEASDVTVHGCSWEVTVEDVKTKLLSVRSFDFILICTGHHAEPNVPRFPGQSLFRGQVLHSRDLKRADDIRGSRHVVVGVGNSGCDVATELSRRGQVYLSTRRGTWLMQRLQARGVPADVTYMSRFVFATALSLPQWILNPLAAWKLNQKVDHGLYGLRPKHGPFHTHPTVNDELPNRIASGHVIVKTNIDSMTSTGVKFDDGSVEEAVDTVVLATGYKIGFPFLDESVLKVQDNNTNLYLHILPPTLTPPTLAVIGCIQPGGAIGPVSEMQCRLAARVFKGRVPLPNESRMMADIEKRHQAVRRRYIHTQRHTIQVDYIPYMDEMALMIGCKPKWSTLFRKDPVLALTCTFGPCTSYQYRLFGPGAWPGARDAIMTQNDRVKFPFSPKPNQRESPELGASITSLGVILAGMVALGVCMIYTLFYNSF